MVKPHPRSPCRPGARQTLILDPAGEHSKIIQRMAESQSYLPARTRQIAIPDSEHHIMVDQPLALVAALRSVLACWLG